MPYPSQALRSSMLEFDYAAIDDAGIRTDFKHIASRSQNIARSLHGAYGAGRKQIDFCFINGFEFNAFASMASTAYRIELNAAVPLFSILLFYKLLADETLLPQIDATGPKATGFGLPFVVDPADFGRRAEWNIELNEIRAFAAGAIADLCSTFVVCHEFGHVLSGHVEGHEHYIGGRTIAELVSVDSGSMTGRDRLQAWEYEADRLAAVLMMNFVEELVDVSRAHPKTNAAFSDGDGFHFEHVLAIAVVSLFAFFTYVQGMRHKLKKKSSHPHPHVRATYLKHMLLQAARNRRAVDLEVFHRLLDDRLAEMMDALERLQLFDPRHHTRRYMRKVDDELARLEALSEGHRDSCAAWRWVD